jgi:hypothetical protein
MDTTREPGIYAIAYERQTQSPRWRPNLLEWDGARWLDLDGSVWTVSRAPDWIGPRIDLTKWQPLVEQAMLEFAAAEVQRAALGEETVAALRARLAADPSRHNPRRPAEP